MTKRTGRPHTGRPTLYREEYAEQAYKLCLLGATNIEMADFFHVNPDTIDEWLRKHDNFSDSITRGKVLADANVAERMYKRALGYSHEAVKIFMPAGAETPVYAPYTEHYPPDTPAASLWLRNRQPRKWRDKVEHDVRVTQDVRELTDAELIAIATAAGKAREDERDEPKPAIH